MDPRPTNITAHAVASGKWQTLRIKTAGAIFLTDLADKLVDLRSPEHRQSAGAFNFSHLGASNRSTRLRLEYAPMPVRADVLTAPINGLVSKWS
jgi:hypothetical protein